MTIVFPGPSSLPNLIAPAIFTPQLVPKLNLHFELNRKELVKIHDHLIEKAPSIFASAKLAVTLLDPIPSVIEPPSDFNSPFCI